VRCQAEGLVPESGSGDPVARDLLVPARATVGQRAYLGTRPGMALRRVPSSGGQGCPVGDHPTDAPQSQSRGLPPRALGFAIGARAGTSVSSEGTFGHSGSSGTLAWPTPGRRRFASCSRPCQVGPPIRTRARSSRIARPRPSPEWPPSSVDRPLTIMSLPP